MRVSVTLSTLLMAVLAFFAARYYKNREAILTEKARKALEQGDFEEAESLLGKVTGNEGETAEETEAGALLNETRYGAAEKLLSEGKYAEARAAFTELGDYADSREKIKECRYREAEALEKQGLYEEAANAFFALSGYGDALNRYDACRFYHAEELEQEDLNGAFLLYRALGSYPGAEEKAQAIAMQLTGASDPALAVQLAQGYSPEEITLIERLFTARAAMPQNALAVGFYHTVGLKADGTVIAAGRNTEGQCETGAWTNITAVKAGAYHTAALKSDGTVVCCGRNMEKQCDTGEWTGITAIACTDYGTAGLKSDGTVVFTGFENGTGVSGWQDVTAIGAGSYITLGIRNGGTLLSTHKSASVSDWSGLVAAEADTGYAVGLTQDGHVLFTGGANGWSDCLSVSAGSTGYAAVTADGRVLTNWFDERNAIDFSDITEAAAVAVGGTHTAVLLKDGRVICRGANKYKECETEGFLLAVSGS